MVQGLVSEDAKTAREAQDGLLKRGGTAVPVLFRKLVEAGWDLKPPLLEVLAEIREARDYARLKLLHGTEEDKTHAALLYELIDQGKNTESPEYTAMVEALLRTLKSEDKNLRAAAGLALIDPEKSTLFFEHLHELVPSLIASFDTDLVIFRQRREDPTEVVFLGICYGLESMIGDRLVFLEFAHDPETRPVALSGKRGVELRRSVSELLRTDREGIEGLRTYWDSWWTKHAKMSATDIGKLLIERNLAFLPNPTPTITDMATWPPAERERYHLVVWSLERWTGKSSILVDDDWKAWWVAHKTTYQGPAADPRR